MLSLRVCCVISRAPSEKKKKKKEERWDQVTLDFLTTTTTTTTRTALAANGNGLFSFFYLKRTFLPHLVTSQQQGNKFLFFFLCTKIDELCSVIDRLVPLCCASSSTPSTPFVTRTCPSTQPPPPLLVFYSESPILLHIKQ